MSRYQSKTILYGVELTHSQATQIYKNEMYEGSDLNEVIEMKTNNENFYKDICSEYDSDPTVPHYLGIVIKELTNKVPDKDIISKYKEVFDKEIKITMEKYGIQSKAEIFILTSVC